MSKKDVRNDSMHAFEKLAMSSGVLYGRRISRNKLGTIRAMRPYLDGYIGLKSVGHGSHRGQVTPVFNAKLVKDHWQAFAGYRTNIVMQGLPVLVVTQKGDVAARLNATFPDEPKYRLLTKVTTSWIFGRLTNMNTLRTLVRKFNTSASYEITSAQRKRYVTHLLPLEFFLMRDQLPGRVVFLNPEDNYVAMKECRMMGIPVAAMADSNYEMIDQVDYLLPGGTRELKSYMVYRQLMKHAVDCGLEMRLNMLLSGEMKFNRGFEELLDDFMMSKDEDDDQDMDSDSGSEHEVVKSADSMETQHAADILQETANELRSVSKNPSILDVSRFPRTSKIYDFEYMKKRYRGYNLGMAIPSRYVVVNMFLVPDVDRPGLVGTTSVSNGGESVE